MNRCSSQPMPPPATITRFPLNHSGILRMPFPRNPILVWICAHVAWRLRAISLFVPLPRYNAHRSGPTSHQHQRAIHDSTGQRRRIRQHQRPGYDINLNVSFFLTSATEPLLQTVHQVTSSSTRVFHQHCFVLSCVARER